MTVLLGIAGLGVAAVLFAWVTVGIVRDEWRHRGEHDIE